MVKKGKSKKNHSCNLSNGNSNYASNSILKNQELMDKISTHHTQNSMMVAYQNP